MSGSNWRIIAAYLGVIGFGVGAFVAALNYPEPERYQRYEYPSEDEAEARASAKLSKTTQYRTPCENPKGAGESDLCAQWRAANAAEESALWTKLGFWTALFGIIGLYWQIVLTRKAVGDTGKATEAMVEANKIAHLGVRPWLRVEEFVVEKMWIEGSQIFFRVYLSIKNYGNSPAIIDRMIFLDALVARQPYNPFWAEEIFAERLGQERWDSGKYVESVVHPKDTIIRTIRFSSKFFDELIFPVGVEKAIAQPEGWAEFSRRYLTLIGLNVSYIHAAGRGTTRVVAAVETMDKHLRDIQGTVHTSGTRQLDRWHAIT
jgi:hypothetical protein